MKIFVFILAVTMLAVSCASGKREAIRQNAAFLDSVIRKSDSTYTKPYFRNDFVTATYYINSKDATNCQVMKDSAGHIRQVIVMTKGIRSFYAPYYVNGQLQAKTAFDNAGVYHGTIINYYADGSIADSGNYTHGVRHGEFKAYDTAHRLTATTYFDSNGQVAGGQ